MYDVAKEIKARVDIRDVAESYGVHFDERRQGKCPFHDDRHPSASIKNGRFHCYVCGLHLDIFEFVQQFDGCSFNGAKERLNDMFRLGLDLKKPMSFAETDRLRRERGSVRRSLLRTEPNMRQSRRSLSGCTGCPHRHRTTRYGVNMPDFWGGWIIWNGGSQRTVGGDRIRTDFARDDFFTTAPYEEVLSIQNPFERDIAIRQMADIAKSVGVMHLREP